MSLRLLAATTLAFGLAASPAAAATLSPLKSCYATAGPAEDKRESLEVAGEGFAAASAVQVLFDGVVVASAPTGSIGEFRLVLPAPYQDDGERALVVTVRDAVTSVTAETRVTRLTVAMKPRRAAAHRRVRFHGRGFTLDAPVYAHYLFGGEEQETVRFDRDSNGPCGTFSVKRRLIPIDDPRPGRWVMQVDQKREYSSEPDPVWVRLPIKVVEVFLEP